MVVGRPASSVLIVDIAALAPHPGGKNGWPSDLFGEPENHDLSRPDFGTSALPGRKRLKPPDAK